MTIAREEIFGPVLCILPYENEEQADRRSRTTRPTDSRPMSGRRTTRTRAASAAASAPARSRSNGASGDMQTPFGGFKMSGNGREYGEFGLRDFLEVKAVIGVDAA